MSVRILYLPYFPLRRFCSDVKTVGKKSVPPLPLCLIPIRKWKRVSERESLLVCLCVVRHKYLRLLCLMRGSWLSQKKIKHTLNAAHNPHHCHPLHLSLRTRGKTAVWNWKCVAITESSCLMQNTQSKHAIKPCVFNERPTIHVRRVIKNVAKLENLRVIFKSKRTKQTWL